MANQPKSADAPRLDWRARLAFENRRFNAWWEGYAFDAAAERAVLSRAGEAAGAPGHVDIAEAIWGEGRLDPGDPAWTMRHARTLGLSLKANIVVLGAGAGAPLRDLAAGTRWRARGYARAGRKLKNFPVAAYESALTQINRAGADGGLCFFDLHRDPDPASLALFAAELVKPNAPFAFIDFTVARKHARLRGCFAEPWDGWPKPVEQTGALIEQSGFRIADIVDETRAFTPLIAKGWARWKSAYELALRAADHRARSAYLKDLASYAHLWAERFDAIRAGQLRVTRYQTRRKG
ncbi:MAG: hypothetical protein R3C51_01470 [Parvularculaceae bacterium]